METKKKQLLILLTGTIYVFFMFGFCVGIKQEQTKMKEMCSEYLQIDISDIKSVKYKDNSLVIDLYSGEQNVSISNKKIYDNYDAELVLDLKDRVKKEDIKIR